MSYLEDRSSFLIRSLTDRHYTVIVSFFLNVEDDAGEI